SECHVARPMPERKAPVERAPLAIRARRGWKMPGSCRAPYGPLGSFLAPLRCWRIQVPSFGQPGRTDRHPEDAGGPLVITSGSGVGVGQLGEHECIAPAGLLRALGMD